MPTPPPSPTKADGERKSALRSVPAKSPNPTPAKHAKIDEASAMEEDGLSGGSGLGQAGGLPEVPSFPPGFPADAVPACPLVAAREGVGTETLM